MDDESPGPPPTGAAVTGGAATLPSSETFSGSISEVAKVYVAETRAALERETWAGGGGYDVARRFSAAVDDLVRFVVDNATVRFAQRYARAHQRCAV
mgnify:CR=1 FL=1